MANVTREKRRPRSGMSAGLIALLVVLGLVGGVLLDRTVLRNLFSRPSALGELTLSESQLDRTVATYTQGRKTYDVSARDVLTHEGALDTSRNADGSYDVPTADDVLATVRGTILAGEATRLGLSVSEDDVLAYAETTLGTRDLGTVAAAYGQSREAIEAQLREAALLALLRAQVVSEAFPEAPVPPQDPAVGEEVTLTEGYAAYVIGLAGDEWDAGADTWRSTDGPFASALADYEITSQGASHEAAVQAYWVAYQAYVSEHADVAALWTDYVNGLLSDATVTLKSLAL